MRQLRPGRGRGVLSVAGWLKRGDVLVFAVFVVLAGVGFLVFRPQAGGRSCEVRAGPVRFEVLLPRETTLVVTGPVGSTVVEIHGREVAVANSDCRAKRCVRQGKISRAGQVIVCAPNRVLVRILGRGPDAVTQ